MVETAKLEIEWSVTEKGILEIGVGRKPAELAGAAEEVGVGEGAEMDLGTMGIDGTDVGKPGGGVGKALVDYL